MTGVLINVCTVIIGSTVGLLFKKSISKKYSDAVMTGIGLCVVLIGISGMLKGENVLVSIISMVIGALIGTGLDIDGRLNGIGDKLSSKIKSKDGEKNSVAEGFVTASLVFCIGAMTILGSLEAGLKGDHTTLITKSILDLFSSMMLSASLGIGVIFAAAFVFVFQGGIVLLAGVLEPILNSAAVAEITCVGSLMIMALGLNLAGISKIKVANYFPALILAPFVCWLFTVLGQYIPALA
ncbi:MAG: DUF554 domain-containing protein [Clostridia bacterium]|nr:DUF554 domain-containing protein [Clostridia bacterium]